MRRRTGTRPRSTRVAFRSGERRGFFPDAVSVFPDVESGASRGPRGRGRVERARRPVRGGDGGDRSGRGRGRVDTGVARTRTRRSVRRRSRRDWRFARATSRFVRAGGVRGLLPSKAQSRTRALASAPAWWSPYAFAARMTLAFSFSASAGLGAGGGGFGGGGVVAGFGGTETTRTRARRGRRSGWCVPRVHARIVDSRFGCRVRSRRRGGWGARRPSWRAGARLGWVVPPGVPNRARVDARGKGVERRGTRDRDTHARTIVIGRSVSRARAATGTEGADGTRDGCARLGTCASRRLFVW